MRTETFIPGIAVLAALATGCGGFDTKDKGKKGSENDAALTGTWETGCLAADALELAHKQSTLIFSAVGDFDRISVLHANEACSSPAVEVAVHGTYDVVGEAEGVEGGADNLNFTIHSATATPKSEDAVRLLSAAKYCGLADWSVDKEVDVAGKECLGERVDQGQVVFDIYRIDDTKLLIGDTLNWFDNTDAKERPTELAADRPYVKQ
jgi:hypothetical protein